MSPFDKKLNTNEEITSGEAENKKNTRKKAEDIFNEYKDKDSANFDNINPDTVRELFHELRVHQIELEMQNDELKKTRDSLELSRAKYFDLYELAPVGYLTLDNKGIILEANLTAANILGRPRASLVKQPFSKYITHEDFVIYFKNQKSLLEKKEPQSYEIHINKSNGEIIWVLLELNLLQFGESSQIFRVVMRDITEQKISQEKITWLLKEKELILKEVHHRIKNNLNTVMSILSIHSNNIENQETIKSLQDAKSRLNTMLVLYNKLYRSENLLKLSFKDYLTPLINEIMDLYPKLENISLNTNLDDIPINVKLLPTVGIIVNELLTNIAKYAFNNQSDGIINVSAASRGNHIRLEIQDNGIGIENIMEQNKKGLGLQLVNLLTEQLDGKLTIDGKKGTSFIIEFDTFD